MKEFLKRVLFFIIPLMVVFSILEVYVRSIPNSYKYKYEYMKLHARELNTLVLGSSHAYRGFNPAYLPGRGFNLAYSSQDIKRDYYLFDKFVDEMDSLKYVVMSFSYHSIKEVMEDWGQSKIFLKYYGIYMDYPDTKYSFELAIPGWIKKVTMHWNGENVCSCDSLGFGIEDNHVEPINVKGAKSTLAYHTIIRDDRIAENKELLCRIAELANSRSASLVLVSTPLTKVYYENMDSIQYQLMLSVASDMVADYDNVIYLNMIEDSRFSNSDFRDVDHLNARGAEKLSKIISDTLLVLNNRKELH